MKTTIVTCGLLLALASAAGAQPRLVVNGQWGPALGVSVHGGTNPLPALGGAGSLAAAGSRLFLGTHDGHVTAFDIRSLEPVAGAWFTASYIGELEVSGPSLFVMAEHEGSGTLHELSLTDLSTRVSRSIPFRPAAIAVADGFVYVGGENGQMVYGPIGGPLAPFPRVFGPINAMVASGDDLYVGFAGSVVSRVRRADGQELSQWAVRGCDAMVIDRGELIVAGGVPTWNFAHRIERYDLQTGFILGEVMLPGEAMDIIVAPQLACGPDMNRDGVLSLADFGAFQTAYALGQPAANFNGDWGLSLADFGAFQTAFALGCP